MPTSLFTLHAHYLLIDTQLADNPAMLHKKVLQLEAEYGLIPRDDLGVVRVMID